MPNQDYIDTKEAAEKWGISEEYVRRLVREGRVKGRKVRRDWIIDSISLAEYMASNRKRGPKAKKKKAKLLDR